MLYKQTLNRAIVYCSPIRKFAPDIAARMFQQLVSKVLDDAALADLSQRLVYYLSIGEWPEDVPPDLDYEYRTYFEHEGIRYLLKNEFKGNHCYWYIYGTYRSSGKYKPIYIGKTLNREKLIAAHNRFQS